VRAGGKFGNPVYRATHSGLGTRTYCRSTKPFGF